MLHSIMIHVTKEIVIIMKKRFLTICAILSVTGMFMACGNSANGIDSSKVAVESSNSSNENSVSNDDNEGAETYSDETDPGADVESDEVDYSVFTSASPAEVQAYAEKVKKAALAKDWDTIGDMIAYPIGSDELNNKCANKEEFIAYANSTGFEDDYFTSLEAWDVSDLWGNYQGACMDDGSIWFSGIGDDDKDFKIISFFGMPNE